MSGGEGERASGQEGGREGGRVGGVACPSERPIQGTYSYYLRVIYE